MMVKGDDEHSFALDAKPQMGYCCLIFRRIHLDVCDRSDFKMTRYWNKVARKS